MSTMGLTLTSTGAEIEDIWARDVNQAEIYPSQESAALVAARLPPTETLRMALGTDGRPDGTVWCPGLQAQVPDCGRDCVGAVCLREAELRLAEIEQLRLGADQARHRYEQVRSDPQATWGTRFLTWQAWKRALAAWAGAEWPARAPRAGKV